jgi:hypothetical protein
LPLKEGDWREDTAKNKTSLIQTNLFDDMGELPLVNFDRFTLQMHVNKLAKSCSKDTVLQMRAYLRDIFEEAVDQDFLSKNPSRRVKIPKNLRVTDTTTLTRDQLRMALELLDESDRILVELDMTDAHDRASCSRCCGSALSPGTPGWSCWRRYTRARSVPSGKPKRVSRRFTFHRCWSPISLPGK